jgi:hypothetical protein
MAWTQTDIDLLDEVLASGEKTVRLANGQLTTFQDTSEILALRSAMVREVASTARSRSTRFKTAVFADDA